MVEQDDRTHGMNKSVTHWLLRMPFLFAILVLPGLVALSQSGFSESKGGAGTRGNQAGLFVTKLPPEAERIVKQEEADERRITVRQASLFYYRFLERCIEDLPEEVTVQYCGILFWGTAHPKVKAEGNIGGRLGWDVFSNGDGVFSVWVSTERTAETVTQCAIEGQKLFVNVSFVKENRSVDQKFKELGGRSVRDVLLKIETK